MVDAALESVRELCREIWHVEHDENRPAAAKALGRVADRLSNIGTVLIYVLLVGYAASVLYRAAPHHWHTSYKQVSSNWWFWVGLVLIGATALRFGLWATKTFKKWNVASLLGSLLLFDLLLKKGPPLFGLAGFSVVDFAFGAIGEGEVGEILQRALGL